MTQKIKSIVEQFEELLGLKLYLVGGSVRDKLLGREHADLDFATPSPPDEIETKIRSIHRRPSLIGKRFGTIGFKYENELIEITTFRTEIYGKSRKPNVTFVEDISKDLSRRDFTVNAMAIDRHGKLIDPWSGYADLKAGVIRFVGNPTIRINEDPLRMLRACRLSAQFQWVAHHETREKMKENAHKILLISRERWSQEMDKMLTSTHPHRGLDMLASTELLRYILPELWIQYHYDQDSPYHGLSLFEHTKKTVQLTENQLLLRWAAMLHDIAKPFTRKEKTVRPHVFVVDAIRHWTRTWRKNHQANYPHHAELGAEFVEKIGRYLRWSNERIKTVKNLVKHHLDDDESPIAHADSAAR